MKINIIYEDNDFLAIDKPAGITVNNSETTVNQDTIQDWSEKKLGLVRKIPSIAKKPEKDTESFLSASDAYFQRGGIVHRLDKETSGILLIAKTIPAFENLQKQFKDRVVEKTYIALAHGKIIPASGEINVPVGRLPWNRKQFGILPGGRESKTLYKVVKSYLNQKTKEALSLVELYPHSGRTHQIRVHLKYINHPVFSDFLYAGRKTSRNDRKVLPRVFLHAMKISIFHPKTGESISFDSPLPQELTICLNSFQEE